MGENPRFKPALNSCECATNIDDSRKQKDTNVLCIFFKNECCFFILGFIGFKTFDIEELMLTGFFSYNDDSCSFINSLISLFNFGRWFVRIDQIFSSEIAS